MPEIDPDASRGARGGASARASGLGGRRGPPQLADRAAEHAERGPQEERRDGDADDRGRRVDSAAGTGERDDGDHTGDESATGHAIRTR